MIKALLVDDEPQLRTYLRSLLEEACADIQVIGEASNIEEAKKLIAQHDPQLVFLDIEMAGGSGFDLLRDLKHWNFEVIFATGHQEFAIQAIRFSALDYLPKPVQPEELAAALERYHARHRDATVRTQVQEQFIVNIAQPDVKQFKLTLSQGDRTFFAEPAEVLRCIADRNYTNVILKNEKRFLQARTLSDFEAMLVPHGFLRLNRSDLMNRSVIDHVDGHDAVLKNGERVEVSRRRLAEVKQVLAG